MPGLQVAGSAVSTLQAGRGSSRGGHRGLKEGPGRAGWVLRTSPKPARRGRPLVRALLFLSPAFFGGGGRGGGGCGFSDSAYSCLLCFWVARTLRACGCGHALGFFVVCLTLCGASVLLRRRIWGCACDCSTRTRFLHFQSGGRAVAPLISLPWRASSRTLRPAALPRW